MSRNLFRVKKVRKTFQYKSVPNTAAGIIEAEKMQQLGWKVIVTGSQSFLMESPKPKKL